MRKLKAVAMITCALVAAGSFTYVNNQSNTIVMAKTISDLEDEKAANDAEIAKLQKEINDMDNDIANEKYKQTILQEKIDIQTSNLEIVSQKIDDINNKIDETEDKIDQLKVDIKKKQKDIDKGMEQFKERLRAMYVSGNDSLASALVGSTDFYDMLSKMELISQVAKHDDELIDSLMTQLEQFEEAQTQLHIAQQNLEEDLETQQAYKEEFTAAITELNEDYQASVDAIDTQQAKINAAQKDIAQYEADNKAKNDEIDKINKVAASLASSGSGSSKKSSSSSSSGGSSNSGSSGSNSGGSSGNTSSGGSSSNGSNNNSYDNDNDYDDDYNDNDYDDDYNNNDYDDEPDYNEPSYSGSMTWPIPGVYVISSPYASRWGSFHGAIDISNGNTMGATVVAADSGTVILAVSGCTHNYGKDSSCGCGGGFGNYIMIDHGNGITTLYGHLSTVNVSVGQSVSRGEAIGSAGSTGWSTGAHLHFEVRVNGSQVDPEAYLY